MMDTNVHVITPGPYRATKLWNEVTRLFRAGMPLKKHRQNFRHHSSCFTASAAVDWLHQLLCNNSNFGPDVTRQQTVQLLKKFLKNHVIEDVKCRWGTEDFEDNNVLYRFPSTSPLKRIPCPHPTSAPGSIKKRTSFRDKEGFFRFKTLKKQNKETQENVDPGLQSGGENQPVGEQQVERRELTVEDEREIWKDITLTHLQKILRVAALDDVLDQRTVNPQNIIHNMTKVNKHGVVSLDNKTNDLPHWLLSAMRSLANWPKYDTAQPSYPGFERDVFKSVSDYFYSLPQPLLTYELYELFINVLALSGYVPAPATHQRGKRKKADLPLAPPPAKASFRSTECLLLSLLRQGTCDETESPMREVLSGKLQSQTAAPKGGSADAFNGQLRGSCLSTCGSMRPPTRSFSLETILDDSSPLSRKHLFLSNDSLAPCAHSNSDITTLRGPTDFTSLSKATAFSSGGPAGGTTRTQLTVVSTAGLRVRQRSSSSRPRSYGSCLDIVVETKEEDVKESKGQGRSVSCLNVNTPAEQNGSTAASSSSRHPSSSSCHPFASSGSTVARAQGSQTTTGPIQPRPASSVSNLWKFPAPSVVRRCLSSLDVSKPSRPASLFRTPLCVPTTSSSFKPPQPKPEHSLVRPQTEGVAIEALQLCTLLLPPASRRKLQLLMRMMSRISQNVDMPRLHPAIATRTLMVHTFSGCVLGSAVEFDLDELLATRLVAFLMDHQESILSVPEYLLGAINDHIEYLRTAQVPVGGVSRGDGGDPDCTPMPIYTFCHQISGSEFENQKLTVTQNAMEELLEQLLRGGSMSEKDRRKKLKQGGKESAAMSAAGEVVIIYGARKEANMEATVCEFQREYPDIYSRRFPTSEREKDKPKIKPALLSIKRTKAFGIRN